MGRIDVKLSRDIINPMAVVSNLIWTYQASTHSFAKEHGLVENQYKSLSCVGAIVCRRTRGYWNVWYGLLLIRERANFDCLTGITNVDKVRAANRHVCVAVELTPSLVA